MPGSADPSPASVRVLCPMPNSASLHHAWLTACPVSSSVCTCTTEDGELTYHTPKKLLSKSCFAEKAVGMYLSILESHMKRSTVLLAVTQVFLGITERHRMQNWSVHKRAARPGTPVFSCGYLLFFSTYLGCSMCKGMCT